MFPGLRPLAVPVVRFGWPVLVPCRSCLLPWSSPVSFGRFSPVRLKQTGAPTQEPVFSGIPLRFSLIYFAVDHLAFELEDDNNILLDDVADCEYASFYNCLLNVCEHLVSVRKSHDVTCDESKHVQRCSLRSFQLCFIDHDIIGERT